MPFIKVSGLSGKLYVPEIKKSRVQKNPCKDCAYCQMCSDDRCRVCLGNHQAACPRKS